MCVERHGVNCASASKSGEMFIPTALTGENVHTARFNGQNVHTARNLTARGCYALARNATFSTNLDTKRHVHLERHGSDVTRVNIALATLGRVHFALVTIATMPPLVHNLLFQFHVTGFPEYLSQAYVYKF